jgi:capsid protein
MKSGSAKLNGHRRPITRANGSSRQSGSDLRMKALGYEGARWSTARGYVYFPTLDTKRDLDSYSLREMRRRSRWIYVNIGFGTRCADGIANMVGSLTPVPLTGDKEWNQLALKSFTNTAGADLIFDVSGKFNFWSCQPMQTALRLVDGDILSVLTESESGLARVMFYEAHQIDNSNDVHLKQDQWENGVRFTPQMRSIAYRIVNEEGNRSVDIPAGSAILNCQFRRPNRLRGEPAFRHAINHFLDRAEIMAFLKQSSKNAAQIGFQIVKNAPTFDPMPSLPDAPESLAGTGAGVHEETPDFHECDTEEDEESTSNVRKVKIEDAFRGGKTLEMEPGEEVKMLLDQRPHPNQVEFLDYLNRDIAWGLGCSSDILWNIVKLGGATARYVLADAQQTLIEPNQQLLADQFCSRFWVYDIAKKLKQYEQSNGRIGLPPCQDPEWWKHGWQPQQKLTVDIGRDGKLYLDMHKAGMISLKRYFGSTMGVDWKPEIDDYLDERAYIVQGVKARNLSMEEAFPPSAGVANITETVTPQDDPNAVDPNLPAGTQPNSATN